MVKGSDYTEMVEIFPIEERSSLSQLVKGMRRFSFFMCVFGDVCVHTLVHVCTCLCVCVCISVHTLVCVQVYT